MKEYADFTFGGYCADISKLAEVNKERKMTAKEVNDFLTSIQEFKSTESKTLFGPSEYSIEFAKSGYYEDEGDETVYREELKSIDEIKFDRKFAYHADNKNERQLLLNNKKQVKVRVRETNPEKLLNKFVDRTTPHSVVNNFTDIERITGALSHKGFVSDYYYYKKIQDIRSNTLSLVENEKDVFDFFEELANNKNISIDKKVAFINKYVLSLFARTKHKTEVYEFNHYWPTIYYPIKGMYCYDTIILNQMAKFCKENNCESTLKGIACAVKNLPFEKDSFCLHQYHGLEIQKDIFNTNVEEIKNVLSSSYTPPKQKKLSSKKQLKSDYFKTNKLKDELWIFAGPACCDNVASNTEGVEAEALDMPGV